MEIDPFTAAPGELLASVADAAPGPFVLSILLMVDRSALTPDDALTYLQLHERVAAWWQSLQADVLTAAAGHEARIDEFLVLDPRPDHDEERRVRIEDAAREEVAAALRLAPLTAQRRIEHGRLLAGPLAATRESLELGDISPSHAAVIADAALRLSSVGTDAFDDDCRHLQRLTLPTAQRGTTSATRRSAARAVERIDTHGQRRRREAARRGRDVFLADEVDGITTLIARLESSAARAAMAAVDSAVADGGIPGECGATIGERRAEVFAELVLHGPGIAGVTVNVDVTVPINALTADGLSTGGMPAEQAQEMEHLADLLADPAVQCALRPVVVDDGGHVLDLGRHRYEPSAALRRLIVARDGTCRFLGCGRRARHCQLDHAQAWEDAGGTDVRNLGALCTRHHQMKTHGGWRIVESAPDGSCTWVSPLGRRYRRLAVPLVDPPRAVDEVDAGQAEGSASVGGAVARAPDPPPF